MLHSKQFVVQHYNLIGIERDKSMKSIHKDKKEIGFQIRSLNHLIKRHVENSANFQYAKSITGTNSWIIAYLAENRDKDIFQKDIEEMFTVNRSTTSKVLKLMEQKELIERRSVPDDARLKKLVLTPKALALHQSIVEDIDSLEAMLIQGFTEEEIQQFNAYIERMKENLTGKRADDGQSKQL
ncbi:MarR family winged helix-turn-helix transcriptional regulator [Desulfitobacterium chlororespirans]|uniref:Transcriptional regulator, MarR family n=1 Tax=Desulfitobacterium chlororespirans DSM 11544 TaxID=1121395 RepID=A0A1M7TXC7_9FIRM|nr:MarR family transcriptional regulator [Desulfitobacterium chlororespirans]SHN75372.1 transcriptional regulator, MarR family [Desulfitobacterium chlororespirans DSM 11544]